MAETARAHVLWISMVAAACGADPAGPTDGGRADGGRADSGRADGGALDCAMIGCGAPPLCSEGCDAPCGCCSCAEGEISGGLLCSGGCYVPVPTPSCPSVAPADGAACDADGMRCHYLLCATRGEVEAACDGSAWDVTEAACEAHSCPRGGDDCEAGEICVMNVGGALIEQCLANPCGEGPMTCECACGGRPCATTPETSDPPTFWVCDACVDPPCA